MNLDIKKAYDQGYLAAIKDLREAFKLLANQHDKTIPIQEIKDEIREMQARYIGFTKATTTES